MTVVIDKLNFLPFSSSAFYGYFNHGLLTILVAPKRKEKNKTKQNIEHSHHFPTLLKGPGMVC